MYPLTFNSLTKKYEVTGTELSYEYIGKVDFITQNMPDFYMCMNIPNYGIIDLFRCIEIIPCIYTFEELESKFKILLFLKELD